VGDPFRFLVVYPLCTSMSIITQKQSVTI
jgi:hypothetical protein